MPLPARAQAGMAPILAEHLEDGQVVYLAPGSFGSYVLAKEVRDRGNRAEIPLDAMRLSFARADSTPGVAQVVKPKILRTQDGRAVTVKAWVPGGKSAAKR